MELHPYCKIFPAMSQEEMKELADDIGKRGLLEPIIKYEGTILDGRSRWPAPVG